ncbi:MAG: L-threonylcarbamoyladenylate synthase [Sphingorhabdus sp.]
MEGTNTNHQDVVAQIDVSQICEAAKILRGGGLVAVPTETVYGLAADASNAGAVAAIYRSKDRPAFNPLIVHVADLQAAQGLAEFDETALKLAHAFWPGPLTLVLPLREGAPVTAAVTAGLPAIALRCPAHRVMNALLLESGLNLAAPSANRSGHISPTCAAHVAAGLGDNAPMILDAGACERGLESTIVAPRENGWQLLREGPLTQDRIEAVLGTPATPLAGDRIEAPGQLARHYAPRKPLRLNISEAKAGEWHIGFGAIAGDDNLSPSGDLDEAASRVFAALHRADASGKSSIAVAPIPADGIGAAIQDRLKRAAAGAGR